MVEQSLYLTDQSLYLFEVNVAGTGIVMIATNRSPGESLDEIQRAWKKALEKYGRSARDIYPAEEAKTETFNTLLSNIFLDMSSVRETAGRVGNTLSAKINVPYFWPRSEDGEFEPLENHPTCKAVLIRSDDKGE